MFPSASVMVYSTIKNFHSKLFVITFSDGLLTSGWPRTKAEAILFLSSLFLGLCV